MFLKREEGGKLRKPSVEILRSQSTSQGNVLRLPILGTSRDFGARVYGWAVNAASLSTPNGGQVTRGAFSPLIHPGI